MRVLFILFVLLILPLAALAYIKDVISAFFDVNRTIFPLIPLIYGLIILTWVAVSLYTAVVYWQFIALVYKMLRLRRWCSQRGCSVIANTIVTKSRPIVWSWTRYLEGAISPSGQKPRIEVVAYDALIAAYMEGLATIRSGESSSSSEHSYTEADGPLLPSNFLLYARCVEQIRDVTAARYGTSSPIRIAIRTLLARDVKRWFNIQRIHLSDDKPIWCTTEWWEHYKDQVRHSNLKQNGICLHRLLRYDPPTEGVDLDVQKQYLRLQFREFNPEREYLTARELIEAKEELDSHGLGTHVRWLDGAELVGNVPEQELTRVRLHPICQVDNNDAAQRLLQWSSIRFLFLSAFENYKNYHETADPSPPKPVKSGAWGKQIGRSSVSEDSDHIVRSNDDLFLVDFFKSDDNVVIGRFGLSFRIEEHKDIAGIKLLSGAEVSNAVEQFDHVWSRASAL